ncbi:MAG: 3'-5' exonuclease [Cyanobacteria bacterium J06632_22]
MQTAAHLHIAEAYYLVLDLEATCTPKDKRIPRTQRETIEIGAVMLNAKSRCIEGAFQQFIRPILNPHLTPYCQTLTTIDQATIDQAPTFTEGLTALLHWANSFGNHCLCAWGEYDRRQLQRDCHRHHIKYPFGERYLDVKKTFATLQRTGEMGLLAALTKLNLGFEGQRHRAIDDAQNTARLMVKLHENLVNMD